jgi:CRP/FNR family transcriptional regulator, cyclic AMP receptor protein
MEEDMSAGDLGKTYSDGELIILQGEVGDCMYVVQSGKVAVFKVQGDSEMHLGTMGEGDFFGEMALLDREVRSASIRAVGEARVLKVDKRTFLSQVHADPTIALRIVQKMSQRIRQLHEELARKNESQVKCSV